MEMANDAIVKNTDNVPFCFCPSNNKHAIFIQPEEPNTEIASNDAPTNIDGMAKI